MGGARHVQRWVVLALVTLNTGLRPSTVRERIGASERAARDSAQRVRVRPLAPGIGDRALRRHGQPAWLSGGCVSTDRSRSGQWGRERAGRGPKNSPEVLITETRPFQHAACAWGHSTGEGPVRTPSREHSPASPYQPSRSHGHPHHRRPSPPHPLKPHSRPAHTGPDPSPILAALPQKTAGARVDPNARDATDPTTSTMLGRARVRGARLR